MWFKSLASVVLVSTVLTGCGGGGGSGTAAPAAESPAPEAATPCATELSAIFDDLLAVTNRVRADNGISSVKFSYKLGQAAQGHAEDMAEQNYFAHHSPDNSSTIASRIEATGYKFSLAAENLAAGYDSATDVVTAWLNSPGHRENLLNSDYTDVGFGLFFDSDPGVSPQATFENYWVQDFGRPTDGNTDTATAYSPDNCSIGNITSGDNAVLNGAITVNDLAKLPGEIDKTSLKTVAASAILTDSPDGDPVSTPEPAVALGLLSVGLGLMFSGRKR